MTVRLLPRSRGGKLVTLVAAVFIGVTSTRLVKRASSHIKDIPSSMLDDQEFLTWMQDPNNDPTVAAFHDKHPDIDLTKADRKQLLTNDELNKAMGAFIAAKTFERLAGRTKPTYKQTLAQLQKVLAAGHLHTSAAFLSWLRDPENTNPLVLEYRENHSESSQQQGKAVDPSDLEALVPLLLEFHKVAAAATKTDSTPDGMVTVQTHHRRVSADAGEHTQSH
jgi:hypothetical protein